jgi:hypothetical protein
MNRRAALLFTLALLTGPQAARAGDTQGPSRPPPIKPAATATKEPIVVSRKDDLKLDCAALRAEVSAMRAVIASAGQDKSRASLQSSGISAAGAVGSLLVGTVTGGIGLAAAGLVLDHNVSEHKDDADELQDLAAQRRTWLKGLYTAQACEGPLETPEQETRVRNAMAEHSLPDDALANIESAAGPPAEQTTLNVPYND